jgi:hypothetical protein
VRELRPGLWHWDAPHPDWSGPENEALRQRLAATAETPSKAGVVSSYAIDNGDQLLLFDPLAAPREIVELAADRQPAIVLTCPWHERDTQSLAERLNASVFVPPPDEGSPDVAWLLAGDTVEGHLFSAGDQRLSESRRSPEGNRATSCFGSRAAARSSPATRSSTSARASRSRSSGYLTA